VTTSLEDFLVKVLNFVTIIMLLVSIVVSALSFIGLDAELRADDLNSFCLSFALCFANFKGFRLGATLPRLISGRIWTDVG